VESDKKVEISFPSFSFFILFYFSASLEGYINIFEMATLLREVLPRYRRTLDLENA